MVRGKTPIKLVSVEVPTESVKVAEGRYEDVLQSHLKRFSPRLSIEEQMRRLALDVYTQGLIDGDQVGQGIVRREPGYIRNVLLG